MNWQMWYQHAPYDWFSRFGMIYPAVWIFVFFWVFAMGACFGSFLNVCIWRIPRKESLSKTASHCTTCGTAIRWFDNLPIISYLILQGKCRHCRTPYSPSYFFVELTCAVLFVLTVLKSGLLKQYIGIIPFQLSAIFFTLGCALIDVKHRIIPDKMSFSAIAIGLLFTLLMPQAWGADSRLSALLIAVISGVIPAGILALFILTCQLLWKRTVIGWGDVKLLLAIGIFLGLPGGIFVLLCGAFTGCIYGLAAIRKWNGVVPFAPFLTFGTLLWIFFSKYILDAYYKFCISW
ncbi:MAG: prepilin peptidase [Lentisphaeria bacterium]|nr:prepilin peptidase [Lentisphaeria bacterium]